MRGRDSPMDSRLVWWQNRCEIEGYNAQIWTRNACHFERCWRSDDVYCTFPLTFALCTICKGGGFLPFFVRLVGSDNLLWVCNSDLFASGSRCTCEQELQGHHWRDLRTQFDTTQKIWYPPFQINPLATRANKLATRIRFIECILTSLRHWVVILYSSIVRHLSARQCMGNITDVTHNV